MSVFNQCHMIQHGGLRKRGDAAQCDAELRGASEGEASYTLCKQRGIQSPFRIYTGDWMELKIVARCQR